MRSRAPTPRVSRTITVDKSVRVMVLLRKAKNIAISAEILKKSLLVHQYLGFLRLSDELDHITLLRDALFINEWIEKT
jgi:hypothetical protein